MKRFLTVALLTVIANRSAGAAPDYAIPTYDEVAANRAAFQEWLSTENPDVEFYTESRPMDGGADTTVALIVDGIAIDEASAALQRAGDWCQIMFLHLNVKACVHGLDGERQWMKMYMGRKHYQHPRKAKQIELDFNSGVTDDGVSWVTLTADEGPYNTSDYYVGLFAIDAENGTYAQFRSSQKTGKAISGAMDLYFATLASNKIGFSVVGTDRKGRPKYSTGTQAMLERNVVRYLLALRIYVQTHSAGGIEGMRRRAASWFDATEQYPEQLREVDRDDYLEDKEKEYRHQQDMQAESGD